MGEHAEGYRHSRKASARHPEAVQNQRRRPWGTTPRDNCLQGERKEIVSIGYGRLAIMWTSPPPLVTSVNPAWASNLAA